MAQLTPEELYHNDMEERDLTLQDQTRQMTPPSLPAGWHTLGGLFSMDLAPLTFMLDPIIPSGNVAALVGPPDSGKSMLARDLAAHIISGKTEFLGFPLNVKHRKAIYIATEDSLETTKAVFRRICAHRIEKPSVKQYAANALAQCEYERVNDVVKGAMHRDLKEGENHLYGNPAIYNLRTVGGFDFDPSSLVEDLKFSLDLEPADLVVIDCFGDVFQGKDLNNNAEMRKSLAPYFRIAQEHGCVILFVTHINKSAYQSSPHQAHVQGASAFAQKVRTILDLRPMEGDPACRLLTLTKGNATNNVLKSKAHKLRFDPETFTFTNTGDAIPLRELDTMTRSTTATSSRKVDINWEEVFGEEKQLQSKEIVRRLGEAYGLQERRCRILIKEHLVSSAVHGWWLSPIEEDEEIPSMPIEPTIEITAEDDSTKPVEQDAEDLFKDSQPVCMSTEEQEQVGFSDDDYADFVRNETWD